MAMLRNEHIIEVVHTSQEIHIFQTFRHPLATFITDEGSQRLPKHLKFVTLLTSVNNLNHVRLTYLATVQMNTSTLYNVMTDGWTAV